jgi:hypothetical protein
LTRHQVRVPVNKSVADVAALFAVGQRRWMQGFLRLATREATVGVPERSPPPRYRLGAPFVTASGGVAVPFIWWPHLGSDLFSRFAGRFVVHAVDSGAVLTLEGETRDGTNGQNGAVLAALLELLSAALSAYQCPDG